MFNLTNCWVVHFILHSICCITPWFQLIMAGQDATSSPSFIYDVFLSFRGDTRHAFTDHLFHALRDKGIDTFRDCENLRAGDEIRPALLEAIEKSRTSMVVLCQNYASSTWCLDELVKIMECSDKGRKRLVLPIFYQVEPSDVRNQKNQYEAAMIKHENRYGKESHKVKAWRSALFEVSELSGKQIMKNSYESEIIKNIVEEILRRLPPEDLLIKNPVGFDPQFDVVESLLGIRSRDALCVLGICGDGERGRTTFSAKLFNKIRHQFDAASFLANVSEKSKKNITGLEDLQKTLLSEMGEEPKTNMGSTFKGSSEIKRRLSHKRVLLVLDDVDCVKQLDSLAGGVDWFGPGSKIIITTRDEDVLDKHKLDGVEIKKYYINEGEFKGKKGKRCMEKEDVVGFNNSFNVIINQLKEEDSCVQVVSIIGMGGLGKTTLSRKIYNSNEAQELFTCRAWGYVSRNYRAKELLLSLLHCLMPSETNKDKDLSEEELKNKVQECLNGKKYLVVLDDIWEPEMWDDMRDAFPNDNNGSRILITSRNQEVANYTNSRLSCYIPLLDEEESWELFCKKVFREEQCPCDLEPIGRSIVESCGGLPLAIITLAGLVARKQKSSKEWSKIKGRVRWHLAQNKTKVMDILKLSYDDLPQRLKPCFLYFGMYPEGHKIYTRELIQLWIAEGFIQPPQESGIPNAPRSEDIGEDYLNELVDRSLVQVESTRSDEGVKTCQVHDLIHDLCILESKAIKFLEVCTKDNCHTVSNPHRLSLLYCAQSYMSSIKGNQADTLSLFLFDKEYPNDALKYFQSIHVLYLKTHMRRIPSELKAMIHLRYLKIQIDAEDFNLRDCICSLSDLEVLDVTCACVAIPNEMWKLKQLRHLLIRGIVVYLLEPESGSKHEMWNLQTLSMVVIEPKIISMLNNGCFPNLTKLGLRPPIFFSQPTPYELCLDEQLPRPYFPTNLRTLKINCASSRLLLDATVFPPQLTKITLTNFIEIDPSCLKALGQLPNLQILKLASSFLAGLLHFDFNCEDGEFPQLEVLHLDGIEVQSWRVVKGAMPCLGRVFIDECCCELPKQLWSMTNLQVEVAHPSRILFASLQNVELKNGCKLIISGTQYCVS